MSVKERFMSPAAHKETKKLPHDFNLHFKCVFLCGTAGAVPELTTGWRDFTGVGEQWQPVCLISRVYMFLLQITTLFVDYSVRPSLTSV